jgi:hypothetical protein
MAKLTGVLLGTAAVVVAGGITATVLLSAQQPAPQPAAAQGGQKPAAPPAPCGPQAQLPGNFSKNVDPKSRCFEIRIYTVDKSKLAADSKADINQLHQRFREKEVALFQKHGAEILGVWQHLGNPDTLVWMLAYRDRAHREDVWAKFGADPEWAALRTKYAVPVSANTFTMSATDYSAMK